MSEIPKAYDPSGVESKWSDAWRKAECFRGKVDSEKEPYCVMIPPPNVTGVLTMGHVLNNTIQDILVRRARQEGKGVLWLPGTDHAGIATQTRVEKELRKEGKTRHDLGRKAFVEKAKQWRDEHGGIITEQLKRLGASCDWERTVHTLDEGYSKGVLQGFVELYKRGYIYRGKRMVNWCPVSQTALSDEEVIMKTQNRSLWTIKYELVDEPGQFLQISTTRPETIMGDVAVAVHPEDPRYQKFVGKKVWRPLKREQIPVVADAAVERDFGTGALKVTPAHDNLDFEIGKRNDLPFVDILNPDGTLNELAGEPFAGMDRADARKKAVEILNEAGAILKDEPHESNVGYSERADVPIEPRLSEQWFLRYPKVEEAKQVVEKGMIRFHPGRWQKIYQHWLNNIQDWCISRQLWWGHRIPVWYKKGEDRKNPDNWHVSVEGPEDPDNWEQEDDCLDTWASSWIWPFATLGWPNPDENQKAELNYWYPTSDLVTGPDIIFFWVARMIMAGLEFMGSDEKTLTEAQMKERIPFRNVYFTGIIRDEKGRKMSKSLGNSPDPIKLIEKYGADGLRFGVINIAPQGQDVLFSEDRVVQGRNFCNKLWNACRFRQMSGESFDNSSLQAILNRMDPHHFDSDDHAVLGNLVKMLEGVEHALTRYEFNGALQAVYAFFWNDFCDWYLEVSKTKLKDETHRETVLAIQDLCIRQVLLTLNPITPFIAEELWGLLGYGKEGAFIQNENPGQSTAFKELLAANGVKINYKAVEEVSALRELVTHTRALKAQYNLGAKRDVKFFYTADENSKTIIRSHEHKLRSAIGASQLEPKDRPTDGAPAVVTPLGTFYMDLTGSVDVAAESKRLQKEIDKLDKVISGAEARLDNEKFLSQAPEAVIAGARSQLEDNKNKREELSRLLKSFEG